jgi:hypothetical protein
VCAATAARFDATGNLLFNAATAGSWTMAYSFKDRAGTVADPGVVTVNVLPAEVLTFTRARWNAPKKAGQLGTLDANGSSSVLQSHSLALYVPNAASGPQGCLNPTAGTKIATTTAGTNGSWTFAATALAAKPTNVYVYSPSLGGCMQALVQ